MAFLSGDPSRRDAVIVKAHEQLKNRLRPEFTFKEINTSPLVVWKARALYQCLIRRALEAADGMRLAWAADNILTSITMARSLIEIGSVIRELTLKVGEATEKKDEKMLDGVIMSVSMANRMKLAKKGAKEFVAQNVLSIIDRMDKQLYAGNHKYGYRDTYDFLSEFVHPNNFGILGLYCDFDGESGWQFGNVLQKKKDILRALRTTLGMMILVDMVVRDFESMIPDMLAFSTKAS